MPGVPLTWLGHSAFRFDTPEGTRVYVDPWLGNPMCPDGEREPERVDLIALTHGHDDHVGDTVALHERFGCPVIAQVELRGWLAGKGVGANAAHAFNKGGTIEVEGVRLTMTDAKHSSACPDGTYAGEAAGLVFHLDGVTVYFAGDTCVFGDMALIRDLYEPTVAVLPIGDHFTMGPREAALALELLGVSRCVPCHYGTFPLLHGTPEQLRELAPDSVEVLAPQPGETIEL